MKESTKNASAAKNSNSAATSSEMQTAKVFAKVHPVDSINLHDDNGALIVGLHQVTNKDGKTFEVEIFGKEINDAKQSVYKYRINGGEIRSGVIGKIKAATGLSVAHREGSSLRRLEVLTDAQLSDKAAEIFTKVANLRRAISDILERYNADGLDSPEAEAAKILANLKETNEENRKKAAAAKVVKCTAKELQQELLTAIATGDDARAAELTAKLRESFANAN